MVGKMEKTEYRILDLSRLKDTLKKYIKIQENPYIIIHDTGVEVKQSIQIVADYHRNVLGYKYIGYDIYIENGYTYETIRLYENIIGAHARGYNNSSIGICLSGHTNISAYQMDALSKIIDAILQIYPYKKILFHKNLSRIKKDPNDEVVSFIMEHYKDNAENKKRYD